MLIPFNELIPTPGNLKIKRARSICHDAVSKVIMEKLQKGIEGTIIADKVLLEI